ncbi:MAG: sulfate ABC transporter permease subunit CysT [Lachnospiraceae bacterium]|nr:sulfate ABC transporter permease subunit CysT [Lachnospiraceae bacterium]RKJ51973.1 sulfate ABC transporter permease subunit CysT [bacterium 1XD42-54]
MKRAQIKKRKSIIPGFGLSMGITVAMLSLLILIPLASVLAYSFRLSGAEFAELMMRPNVVQAFVTSIGCALAAAVLNCIFGTILAWVLVRYEFPGKRLMDGMIELPFALPTAVAGITLTKMYSDTGAIGRAFEKLGIEIAYTRTGIIIAMVFIGIPFVVRAIQPVLEKLPATYEEAAGMLGASRLTIFWKVIFPEIRPALLTGFGLALARGIGEYGSVIYISGNSEKNGTQVVSYVIMQKLNSGNVDYEGAAAIALVLLILSFVMLFAINFIQHIASRRTNV